MTASPGLLDPQAKSNGTTCPSLTNTYPYLTIGEVTWQESTYPFLADRLENATTAADCALAAYNWIASGNALAKKSQSQISADQMTLYQNAILQRQVMGKSTFTQAYFTFYQNAETAAGGTQCWVRPGCDATNTSGANGSTTEGNGVVSGLVAVNDTRGILPICLVMERRGDCLENNKNVIPEYCSLTATNSQGVFCRQSLYTGLSDAQEIQVDQNMADFCLAFAPQQTSEDNIPSECLCVAREKDKTYQAFNSLGAFASGSDFCWWQPCKERTTQAYLVLNEMQNERLNVACKVESCNAIISIANSQNVTVNGDISQDINCTFIDENGSTSPIDTITGTVSSSATTAAASYSKDGDVKTSTLWLILIIAVVLIVVLLMGGGFLLYRRHKNKKSSASGAVKNQGEDSSVSSLQQAQGVSPSLSSSSSSSPDPSP